MTEKKDIDDYLIRGRVKREIDTVAGIIGASGFLFGGALWFLVSSSTGFIVAATLLITSFVVSLYGAFI